MTTTRDLYLKVEGFESNGKRAPKIDLITKSENGIVMIHIGSKCYGYFVKEVKED